MAGEEKLITSWKELLKVLDGTASVSTLVGGTLMLVGAYKVDKVELVKIPINNARVDQDQMIGGQIVAKAGDARVAISLVSGSKTLPISSLGQSERTTIDGNPFSSMKIADLDKLEGKFIVVASRAKQTDRPLDAIPGREKAPQRFEYKYICFTAATQAEADSLLKQHAVAV